MKASIVLATLVAALFESAQAGANGHGSNSIYSTQHCYTTMGASLVAPVPTTSVTFTKKYYVTKERKVTPKTTVTPSMKYETATQTQVVTTTVTENPATDTVETDVTQTVSTTTTLNAYTSWQTVTDTTVSTVGTVYTVSAVPSYAKIQDTLSGATDNGAGTHGSQASKRSEEEGPARQPRAGSLKARQQADADNAAPLPPANVASKCRLPQSVNCRETVYQPKTTVSINSNYQTKTVSLPEKTQTSTVTQTSTATQTVYPSHITVVTTSTLTTSVTYTQSPTTSATTTTTETDTVYTPTSTVYAQCTGASADIGQGNRYLFGATPPRGVYGARVGSGGYTAYDCCVSCLLNPNCVMGGVVINGGQCWNFNASPYSGTTCTNPSQYKMTISEGSSSTGLVYYFNGNCGQISSYTGSQSYSGGSTYGQPSYGSSSGSYQQTYGSYGTYGH